VGFLRYRSWSILAVFILFGLLPATGQTWELEISSTVEIRALRLSNKVEKEERPLRGATVALYQGNTIVKQVTTDGNGDFAIGVPPNGDFFIVVSYQDNNQKRFQVSTKGARFPLKAFPTIIILRTGTLRFQ
jgi:hypothetical protein